MRGLFRQLPLHAVSFFCLACVGLSRIGVAEDAGLNLSRTHPWTTAFAEEDVLIKSTVRAVEAWDGRLVWGLANREMVTLSRGEMPIRCAANAQTEIAFPLKLPAIKPGLILPSVLTLALISAGAKEPAVVHQSPIWLYPADPFHERRMWLEELRIGLYDPAGATAERLTKEKFPFEPVATLGSLSDYSGRLLLVGEGVSLREERGLAEVLFQLAEQGVAVVCLAPTGGDFSLPSRDDDKRPRPTNFLLQDNEAITRLDKRLDAAQWNRVRAKPEHTLRLTREGSQLLAEVVGGEEGWPWLEMQFPLPNKPASTVNQRRGCLLICCLPLVRNWDEGPTPRFLFARMIDYVTVGTSVLEPAKEPGAP